MPKTTLLALPQIVTPATRSSNDALLSNIAAFNALNAREKLALSVYFMARQLQQNAVSPTAQYDPDVAAKVQTLVQDAEAVMGNIPTGDLDSASVAICFSNALSPFPATPTDIDTLRDLVKDLCNHSEEELRRICLYLRLEIGI